MKDIKKKIIDVSRELFIAQGFKKTTTRQIIEKAEIRNGSLYHYFKNKDEIFQNIIMDVFTENILKAERLVKDTNDPALLYSVEAAIELKAVKKYNRVAELFYEAHNSWDITQIMMLKLCERNKLLFHLYNPEFTDEDYYIRTLGTRGCMHNFIAEGFYKNETGFEDKLIVFLNISLSIFNVPKEEIDNAIKKSINIVDNGNIEIYGFKI